VFAAHPDLYRWYQQNFYRTLFENGDGTMVADMRWKELIRLKISLSHGYSWCNSFTCHGRAAGIHPGPDRLDPRSHPGRNFSPAELAVLELGDQISMQNLDGALTPDLHEAAWPGISLRPRSWNSASSRHADRLDQAECSPSTSSPARTICPVRVAAPR